MAFLGSLGKALGLGSTQQVLGASAKAAAAAYAGQPQIATAALGGAFQQQGQSVAYDAPSQTIPQETQQSSVASIVPYLGGGAGMFGQAFRQVGPAVGKFFGSPAGQIATGVGTGLGIAMLGEDGQVKQMRFTRKQQMQIKEMVELLGFEQTLAILGVDASTLAFMLTKKFPRRGQGITAAQLRNAQRVNNKIVHMHDKLKSSFGTATRRTTTRRTAGTRVTQIKN